MFLLPHSLLFEHAKTEAICCTSPEKKGIVQICSEADFRHVGRVLYCATVPF